MRDSTITTIASHQGGETLSLDGTGDPDEVRRVMEKALGRRVTLEVEEICWCGCGKRTKTLV
jgi:hypothetical protein